jgi:hypothetical protein
MMMIYLHDETVSPVIQVYWNKNITPISTYIIIKNFTILINILALNIKNMIVYCHLSSDKILYFLSQRIFNYLCLRESI